MVSKWNFITFFILMNIAKLTVAVELTFELYDNSKDCFYEVVEKNISVTLEFQVISGGQYDVDVVIEAPDREILYQQQKMQYDSHTFTTKHTGVYAVCFSNEFSTFTHKIVYMDLQVGEEPTLPTLADHITVMTLMETASHDIHKRLNSIIDFQTHHRLREATSRKRAEELNETVLYYSLGETLILLVTLVSQVLIMKNFFTEKRLPPTRLIGR